MTTNTVTKTFTKTAEKSPGPGAFADGSSVLVEGRLKLDTWEKDGKKNSKLRVIGERLVMLGRPPGSNGAGQPAMRRAESAATATPDPAFLHR